MPAISEAKVLIVATDGFEESEFRIPGHVVADIALAGEQAVKDDGSVELTIEALTVEE